MRANNEAAAESIGKTVDAMVLAGAWRAYNAAEAMADSMVSDDFFTEDLDTWRKDADNLRAILNERSEGP